MRTTVNIADHVLRRAKLQAEQEGMSMGELVTASLVEHMTRQAGPSSADRVDLPVVDCAWAAPVDSTSNRAVADYLDALDARAAS